MLKISISSNIARGWQEDMLMGTLTVRENLAFSAALRLAGSKEEKQASVDKIISQLELTKCADSKVLAKLVCLVIRLHVDEGRSVTEAFVTHVEVPAGG